MPNPLPIPDDLRAEAPTDARAASAAVFLATGPRAIELEATARDLEGRLELDSTDPPKPPSSHPVGMRRRPPAPPGGTKRGGRPGHREARRASVAPEEVHETPHCAPDSCRRRGRGPSGETSKLPDPDYPTL